MRTRDGKRIPPMTSGRLNLRGEKLLYFRIQLFLREHYPDVIYRFDVEAGLYVKTTTTNKALKSLLSLLKWTYRHDKGYPDLFIAEPNRDYLGLFVEVKVAGTRIRRLNGGFASGHLVGQAIMLNRLADRKYKAVFGIGDDVFQIIEDYLDR